MTSLLQIVGALLRDPIVKAEYLASPDDFMSRHGFPDLEPAEIEEVLLHVADASPPAFAMHIDSQAGLDGAASLDIDRLDHPFGIDFDADPAPAPDDLDTVDVFDAPPEPPGADHAQGAEPEFDDDTVSEHEADDAAASEHGAEPAAADEPDAAVESDGDPQDQEGDLLADLLDELDAGADGYGSDAVYDELYPTIAAPGHDLAGHDLGGDDLFDDDILDDVGDFDDPVGFEPA